MSHHTMTLLLFNWFSAAVHKKLLLHPDLNQASSEGQDGGRARNNNPLLSVTHWRAHLLSRNYHIH